MSIDSGFRGDIPQGNAPPTEGAHDTGSVRQAGRADTERHAERQQLMNDSTSQSTATATTTAVDPNNPQLPVPGAKQHVADTSATEKSLELGQQETVGKTGDAKKTEDVKGENIQEVGVKAETETETKTKVGTGEEKVSTEEKVAANGELEVKNQGQMMEGIQKVLNEMKEIGARIALEDSLENPQHKPINDDAVNGAKNLTTPDGVKQDGADKALNKEEIKNLLLASGFSEEQANKMADELMKDNATLVALSSIIVSEEASVTFAHALTKEGGNIHDAAALAEQSKTSNPEDFAAAIKEKLLESEEFKNLPPEQQEKIISVLSAIASANVKTASLVAAGNATGNDPEANKAIVDSVKKPPVETKVDEGVKTEGEVKVEEGAAKAEVSEDAKVEGEEAKPAGAKGTEGEGKTEGIEGEAGQVTASGDLRGKIQADLGTRVKNITPQKEEIAMKAYDKVLAENPGVNPNSPEFFKLLKKAIKSEIEASGVEKHSDEWYDLKKGLAKSMMFTIYMDSPEGQALSQNLSPEEMDGVFKAFKKSYRGPILRGELAPETFESAFQSMLTTGSFTLPERTRTRLDQNGVPYEEAVAAKTMQGEGVFANDPDKLNQILNAFGISGGATIDKPPPVEGEEVAEGVEPGEGVKTQEEVSLEEGTAAEATVAPGVIPEEKLDSEGLIADEHLSAEAVTVKNALVAEVNKNPANVSEYDLELTEEIKKLINKLLMALFGAPGTGDVADDSLVNKFRGDLAQLPPEEQEALLATFELTLTPQTKENQVYQDLIGPGVNASHAAATDTAMTPAFPTAA